MADESMGQELGDLRLVEAHAAELLKGNPEAEKALVLYGRDAAGILERLAEQHESDVLKKLAKRLVAVPPQVKTNLASLRAESITALVDDALTKAPDAAHFGELRVRGENVALFDPRRVSDAILRGGRPRRDVRRIEAGDLVWFGVDGARRVTVRLVLGDAPEVGRILRLRLKVDSGVVFVGPPEAADGPRLGELRLDPFRTALHDKVAEGRLVRLPAGTWLAAAQRGPEPSISVYLTPDPAPDEPRPPVDLSALGYL